MTETDELRSHGILTALTFIEGLGHALTCQAYHDHRPKPARFIWHHILPQVCGGRTTKSNLATLCDNCHYGIHALLYQLKLNNGVTAKIPGWHLYPKGWRELAEEGYHAAVLAGTADRIPDEGLASSGS